MTKCLLVRGALYASFGPYLLCVRKSSPRKVWIVSAGVNCPRPLQSH